MFAGWLSKLAFALSLLVAFSVLAPQERASGQAAPSALTQRVQLGVTVDKGSEGSAQVGARVIIYAEQESPAGIVYHRAASGALPVGSRHTWKLPPGHYRVVLAAPGFARELRRVALFEDGELSMSLRPARSLSVQVVHDHEGQVQPLSGATVLAAEPGEMPHGAKTDAQGKVSWSDLGPGPIGVRIFAPGFESYEAQTEGDLVVRLRKTSILRVRVVRGDRPRPGAKVFIAGVQLWPTRSIAVSSKGWVDISGLKPGQYSLYACDDEWISPQERVSVVAEAGVQEVVLSLHEGKFVVVRVVSSKDGLPLSGARVSLSEAGVGQFSLWQVTDRTGFARLGPLQRVGGLVRVRAHGYVPKVLNLDQVPGGTAQEILVELILAGRVVGRVVDEQGFPVAGATLEAVGVATDGAPIAVTFRSEAVSDAHFDWARELNDSRVLLPAGELGVMLGPVPAIPLGGLNLASTTPFFSDEKGHFELPDVPPGKLVIFARHPEFIDAKSETIETASGQTKSTQVVLLSGKPLSGRVYDHRDFPVPGARVLIVGRHFERRVFTESDGTFRVAAAPTQVSLRVSDPDDPFQVKVSMDVAPDQRNEEVRVQFQQPRGDVEVEVFGREGEGLDLAEIKVSSLDPKVPLSFTRFTDARGHALLPEMSGLKVRMRVQASGYVEYTRQSVLSDSERVELVPAIDAEGRALGVRGRLPAEGAVVRFSSGSFQRTTIADDVGGYRFLGVPPGLAVVSASHPEYGKVRVELSVEPTIDRRPAQLPDLVLEEPTTVEGRVVDDQGRPVAGAWISLERVSAYGHGGPRENISGISDGSGSFQVELEPRARFHLYAALPARAFGWSAEILRGPSDATSEVAIVLDHFDEVSPHQRATVLVTLRQEGSRIVVYAVAPGSGASRDGLAPEDVIESIQGVKPLDVDDARDLLSGSLGSEVRLVVRRRGTKVAVFTSTEPFALKADAP